MMFNLTKTKVAVAFATGIILMLISGLFVKVSWLFVTSMLIGIVLVFVTMGYTVHQLVYFLYRKLNDK